MKFSVELRNARLNALETLISNNGAAAPRLVIYGLNGGTMPTSAAADISNATLYPPLATMTLPADWLDPAASGSIAKKTADTWTVAASTTVTRDAQFFAIHKAVSAGEGTKMHVFGTISLTNGSGDMWLDNISIAQNQTITINSFTLADGNV